MRHQRHRKTDTLAGPRRPVTYRAVLSLLYPKPSRVSRSLRPLWLIVCLMPFPCAQFKYASKTLEAFEQASGSRSQTSSTNCATWSASKRHSCFAVSVEPGCVKALTSALSYASRAKLRMPGSSVSNLSLRSGSCSSLVKVRLNWRMTGLSAKGRGAVGRPSISLA